MKLIRLAFLTLSILLFTLPGGYAQPVDWTATYAKRADGGMDIIIRAKLAPGWHVYSVDLPKGGPSPTSIHFNNPEGYTPQGGLSEAGRAIVEHDPIFDLDLRYFADSLILSQRIQPEGGGAFEVSATVSYQTCHEGACNIADFTFKLPIDPTSEERLVVGSSSSASSIQNPANGESQAQEAIGANAISLGPAISLSDPSANPLAGSAGGDTIGEPSDSSSTPSKGRVGDDAPEPPSTPGQPDGLFFLLAFLAGLAALLTPCVFPMIPMTVSFFLDQEGRARSLASALTFGLGIIAIYTLLGLAVSLTSLGAEAITSITTHWLTNLLFFALFVVFAASFFGMFEIRLPSSLATKADSGVARGGLMGAFFLALTTVIVSLSCVGPIVGALLVESAAGSSLRPVVGMFSFALGFSLPFTLLALFPSWLKRLPKSGGWMNSIKVVLGFVVLALSLKFLLGLDIALGLHLLTRPLFIALWIAIALLLGLYLLGLIRFKMDSPLGHVPFPRLILALLAFTFSIYLLPGLFGAPLYSLSGLLPAPSPDDFSLTVSTEVGGLQEGGKAALCEPPKYSEEIALPRGLQGYRDYQQAISCARELNRPLLLEFTGHGCANCKEMAARVLSRSEVAQLIGSRFVYAALYVDDRTPLAEDERYTSPHDGREKTTVGQMNLDLELHSFGVSGQPLFLVVSPDGSVIAGPKGRDTDVDSFLDFLRSSLAKR
ncbi:MAG: disulfide bond formation protein DsbD [Bacteroidetes bacterium]|nr:MAG: disulfide bond formation protein DsbD [Bacteroidota bacterium]